MMVEDVKQPGPNSAVSLREITQDTLPLFLKLDVAESQTRMVANNAVSIAEAYFEKYAWFRGIYADETPVGFVMLYDNPDKPEYYLWRLMIGAAFQGMGYGRQAIALLATYVKSRPNATELLVSHVKDMPGNPGPFYEKLGFDYTGEEDDGELVMRLAL